MMDVIVFIFNPWLQIKPGLCSACCCFKSQPQPHVAETSSAAPGDRERVSHIETNLCLSSLSPRWRCQGLGADRRQFCRKSVRYRARPRRTSVSHGTGVRGEGGTLQGPPSPLGSQSTLGPAHFESRGLGRDKMRAVQLGSRHENLEIWQLGSLAA